MIIYVYNNNNDVRVKEGAQLLSLGGPSHGGPDGDRPAKAARIQKPRAGKIYRFFVRFYQPSLALTTGSCVPVITLFDL